MKCAHCKKPFKVGDRLIFTDLGNLHIKCRDKLTKDRHIEDFEAFCKQYPEMENDSTAYNLYYSYADWDQLDVLHEELESNYAVITSGIEDNEYDCVGIRSFTSKKSLCDWLSEALLETLVEKEEITIEYILHKGKIIRGWWDIKLKVNF